MRRMGTLSRYRCQRRKTAFSCDALAPGWGAVRMRACVAMGLIIPATGHTMKVTEVPKGRAKLRLARPGVTGDGLIGCGTLAGRMAAGSAHAARGRRREPDSHNRIRNLLSVAN